MAETLKKFLVFLPNLKSVTGNSEGIDQLVKEVKNLVKPLEHDKQNFFNKANGMGWKTMNQSFNSNR